MIKRFSPLTQRLISAFSLGLIVLLCLLGGPPWSTSLILLVCVGLFTEWVWFFHKHRHPHRGGDFLIFLGGLIYLGSAFLFCWRLAEGIEDVPIFFYLVVLVWTTDISAYVVGKSLGGKRLAPRISPHKTWSGFWGGLIGGSCAGLLAFPFSKIPWSPLMICGGTLALVLVAQAGDLLESAVKRYFGTKDSSSLIPGHGGLWDRLDSFIAVAFVLFCLSFIS